MSLKETFETKLKPSLQKELGVKNPMAVPLIKTITVTLGTGSRKDNASYLDSATKDLEAITGQKPAVNTAKKSVAGFKVRQGQPVGLQVTLRGPRMWDFFEKLISIDLPRTRDFKGFSKKSMDKRGNISIGISEHTIFPEIDPNKVDIVKSLGVAITTTAENDEAGYKLLKILGFPFRD